MKPIAKSQLNYSELLSFILLYGVLFSIVWLLTDSYYFRLASVVVLIILLYIPMFVFVNRYYFYDDCFIVVYLFRFTRRKKVYLYSDISIAKYMNMGGKGNRAWIVLVFKGKKFSKIFRSYFSFSHYSFKKRKELLLLLKQKGVPVEVNSIFKIDNSILNETL